MKRKVIEFEANEQSLSRKGALIRCVSGTIHYLKAHFVLGKNWDNFDKVYAVWESRAGEKSTLLNEQNECYIPSELTDKKGYIRVNLEGIKGDSEEVLTTYPEEALIIDEVVPVEGEPSQPIRINDIKN